MDKQETKGRKMTGNCGIAAAFEFGKMATGEIDEAH